MPAIEGKKTSQSISFKAMSFANGVLDRSLRSTIQTPPHLIIRQHMYFPNSHFAGPRTQRYFTQHALLNLRHAAFQPLYGLRAPLCS